MNIATFNSLLNKLLYLNMDTNIFTEVSLLSPSDCSTFLKDNKSTLRQLENTLLTECNNQNSINILAIEMLLEQLKQQLVKYKNKTLIATNSVKIEGTNEELREMLLQITKDLGELKNKPETIVVKNNFPEGDKPNLPGMGSVFINPLAGLKENINTTNINVEEKTENNINDKLNKLKKFKQEN